MRVVVSLLSFLFLGHCVCLGDVTEADLPEFFDDCVDSGGKELLPVNSVDSVFCTQFIANQALHKLFTDSAAIQPATPKLLYDTESDSNDFLDVAESNKPVFAPTTSPAPALADRTRPKQSFLSVKHQPDVHDAGDSDTDDGSMLEINHPHYRHRHHRHPRNRLREQLRSHHPHRAFPSARHHRPRHHSEEFGFTDADVVGNPTIKAAGKWPGATIPFAFVTANGKATDSTSQMLTALPAGFDAETLRAMGVWEKDTCIAFKPQAIGGGGKMLLIAGAPQTAGPGICQTRTIGYNAAKYELIQLQGPAVASTWSLLMPVVAGTFQLTFFTARVRISKSFQTDTSSAADIQSAIQKGLTPPQGWACNTAVVVTQRALTRVFDVTFPSAVDSVQENTATGSVTFAAGAGPNQFVMTLTGSNAVSITTTTTTNLHTSNNIQWDDNAVAVNAALGAGFATAVWDAGNAWYVITTGGPTLIGKDIQITPGAYSAPGMAAWPARLTTGYGYLIPNGCEYPAILHELGHASGLMHAMCRDDPVPYFDIDPICSTTNVNYKIDNARFDTPPVFPFKSDEIEARRAIADSIMQMSYNKGITVHNWAGGPHVAEIAAITGLLGNNDGHMTRFDSFSINNFYQCAPVGEVAQAFVHYTQGAQLFDMFNKKVVKDNAPANTLSYRFVPNTIQSLTVTGSGGDFVLRLTPGNIDTAAIPYNNNDAVLGQNIDDALFNAGITAYVRSLGGGVFNVAFLGLLSGTSVNNLILQNNALSGGGTVVVANVQVGDSGTVTERHTITYTGVLTQGSYTLTLGGYAPSDSIQWNVRPEDRAATIQAALITALGAGNVAVSNGAAAGTYVVDFLGEVGMKTYAQMTVTTTGWGTGTVADAQTRAANYPLAFDNSQQMSTFNVDNGSKSVFIKRLTTSVAVTAGALPVNYYYNEHWTFGQFKTILGNKLGGTITGVTQTVAGTAYANPDTDTLRKMAFANNLGITVTTA